MPLFTYPFAQQVLDDSGLRTEQINALYTSNNALADIEEKIGQKGRWVERLIMSASASVSWPFTDECIAAHHLGYTADECENLRSVFEGSARDATGLEALYASLTRSGQLNKAYTEKAEEYHEQAMLILFGDGKVDFGLIGDIKAIVAAQPGANTPDEQQVSYSSSVPQILVTF